MLTNLKDKNENKNDLLLKKSIRFYLKLYINNVFND